MQTLEIRGDISEMRGVKKRHLVILMSEWEMNLNLEFSRGNRSGELSLGTQIIMALQTPIQVIIGTIVRK